MEPSTTAGSGAHAPDSTSQPSSSTGTRHPDAPLGTLPLTREQEFELISPYVRASIDANRALGLNCKYYGSVAKPWLPYPVDETAPGVQDQIAAEMRQAKIVFLLGEDGENGNEGEENR